MKFNLMKDSKLDFQEDLESVVIFLSKFVGSLATKTNNPIFLNLFFFNCFYLLKI